MNCPYCGAKPMSVSGYECGTGLGAYHESSPRCRKAQVLNLKERIKRLEEFLADVSKQWECDCWYNTGPECKCCRAEGLLKEAKP